MKLPLSLAKPCCCQTNHKCRRVRIFDRSVQIREFHHAHLLAALIVQHRVNAPLLPILCVLAHECVVERLTRQADRFEDALKQPQQQCLKRHDDRLCPKKLN